MAFVFYKGSKQDTISPLSYSTIIGSYSANDTWFAVLANKFYFKEDLFRSKVVGIMGVVNFQTYLYWGLIRDNMPPNILLPVLPPLPEDGAFIQYRTNFYFAYVDFTVNLYDRLYAGLDIIYSNSKTTFDLPSNPFDTQDLFGFGLSSDYNITDNQMQPLEGGNGVFNTTSFLQAL
jgi:hypothetical protein